MKIPWRFIHAPKRLASLIPVHLNVAILLVTLLLPVTWGLWMDATTVNADSPQITTYVVPPVSNEKILPDTSISSDYISDQISFRASRGEFQPASFVIHSNEDISDLQISTTHLISGSNSISPENIDIRVVKCWYQAGYDISDSNHKHLTPELLLKDDSLIKVENGENYLKLTNGTYMWISDPSPVPKYQRYSIDEIPVTDAQSLQPLDIPANTNKQFWITAKVPLNTPDGSYTGHIELSTPTGLLHQINLTLQVLPFTLSRPVLTYSIYYYGILHADWPNGSIGPRFKSEEQLRAELQNLFDHGVTNPVMLQYYSDETRLRRHLEIRDELGLDTQPLFYRGLDYLDTMDKVPIAERIMEIASDFGISEVYFYGRDEALTESVEWLTSQRPVWEAVRQLGGKIYASGVRVNHYSPPRDPGNFGFMGDIQDLLICHGPPSAEEAANWHSVDHKIFCYSNPQVGVEQPETYRRNFGLLLWQNDYDGAMNYAYNEDWGNPWNDFDSTEFRGHMFAYYTIDGVIDTIQWEGWREAVTDVRYLSTLLEIIETAKSEGKDTSNAEAWLADLKNSDLTTQNLDNIRSQMIDYIVNLRSNYPPVLDAIGNKSVNEGQPLQFTISATDPDDDPLVYSASNLPSGATFNQNTRTFAWTPVSSQTGSYPDICFEVSDGSLSDTEEIKISVISVPAGNGDIDDDKPQHTNWWLIGGLIAGCTILLVLLVSYLVTRK